VAYKLIFEVRDGDEVIVKKSQLTLELDDSCTAAAAKAQAMGLRPDQVAFIRNAWRRKLIEASALMMGRFIESELGS
jgi:hypothetical protein